MRNCTLFAFFLPEDVKICLLLCALSPTTFIRDVKDSFLVSTAQGMVGCGPLRVVGYAEHRDVGHGHLNQEAPITILELFTEHAVNND